MQAIEELLIEAQHYRVRAVYRLLLIKVVSMNIQIPKMSQVLGLVALINTHKVSKARHSAESGSMRYRPVRKCLSLKECFTILAGTSIVATATSVVVRTTPHRCCTARDKRNLQAGNEKNG